MPIVRPADTNPCWSVVIVDKDELQCDVRTLPYSAYIGVIDWSTSKVDVWTPAAGVPRGYREAAARLLRGLYDEEQNKPDMSALVVYRDEQSEKQYGASAAGKHYAVMWDGRPKGTYICTHLRDAVKLARKAVCETYYAPYTQSLIFRGDLPLGQVSGPCLSRALQQRFGEG